MKSSARLALFVCALALATFLFWGLAASWSLKGIGSSEVASWVQAFGAIGAIAVAVYLMHAQHQLQTGIEESRDKALQANLLLVAIMCGQETYAAFETLDQFDVEESNATLQLAEAEFISVHLKGTLAYAESSPFWEMPSSHATKFAMIRQSCRALIGALSGALAEKGARTSVPTQFPMASRPRVRGDRIFASVKTGMKALPGLIESLRSSYKEITGTDAPT